MVISDHDDLNGLTAPCCDGRGSQDRDNLDAKRVTRESRKTLTKVLSFCLIASKF